MVSQLAKQSYLTFKTKGVVQFTHSLKQFNSKDRVRIIRETLRTVMKPGAPELERRTPRAEGKQHKYAMTRRRKMGWQTVPEHADDAASFSVRKSTKHGTITAKLGYKKGIAYRWYANIQTVGYTLRDGKKTKPKTFATRVIKKYVAKVYKEVPIQIEIKSKKRMKRLLKAKLKVDRK